MRLNRLISAVVPAPMQLPARFWRAQLTGRLERELHLVAGQIGPRDAVVDVGANVGMYSYALARRGALVHAFEPLACRRHLEACQHPRIRLYGYALSNESGRLHMHVPLFNGRPNHARASIVPEEQQVATRDAVYEEVVVRTLDSFDLRGVTFIKIDTEGAELQVLGGARELIARDRPVMLIEIEQRHLGSTPIERALEQIEDMGYEGRFLRSGRLLDLSSFDLARDQLSKVEQVEATGFASDYVNNFLFLPRGRRHGWFQQTSALRQALSVDS